MIGEENNRNTSTEKKQKQKKASGIAAFSLLITLLDRLGEIIYTAILNSFIGRAFTSYTPLRQKMSSGICATIALKSGRVKRFCRRIRKFLANHLENCFSISFARRSINSPPFCFVKRVGLTMTNVSLSSISKGFLHKR